MKSPAPRKTKKPKRGTVLANISVPAVRRDGLKSRWGGCVTVLNKSCGLGEVERDAQGRLDLGGVEVARCPFRREGFEDGGSDIEESALQTEDGSVLL